jgi:hypothetical protein
MIWPVNYCVFAVEDFSQTLSVMQMERIFRPQFDVPRLGRIPNHDTFLKMVINFCVCGTSEFVGSACSVCTPENILSEGCSATKSLLLGYVIFVGLRNFKHSYSMNFMQGFYLPSLQNSDY